MDNLSASARRIIGASGGALLLVATVGEKIAGLREIMSIFQGLGELNWRWPLATVGVLAIAVALWPKLFLALGGLGGTRGLGPIGRLKRIRVDYGAWKCNGYDVFAKYGQLLAQKISRHAWAHEVDTDMKARFFTGDDRPDGALSPREIERLRAMGVEVDAIIDVLHAAGWITTDSKPTTYPPHREYWLTPHGVIALKDAGRALEKRLAALFPAG